MYKLTAVVLLCLVSAGCNGIQSASVNANPVTMTIGADLVFKNGVWIRQARSLDCAANPERIMQRAVTPCDDPATRFLMFDNRSAIRSVIDTGGGVRAIAGGMVSTRATLRAAHKTAREIRDEEKEAYETLKEIHKEEKARLTNIANATNPSMFGAVRRAFKFGCQPEISIPATANQTVVSDTNNQTSNNPTPNVAILPDPNNTGDQLGNGSIPPPSDKSIKNIEIRIASLEEFKRNTEIKIQSMDGKLDQILAALKH